MGNDDTVERVSPREGLQGMRTRSSLSTRAVMSMYTSSMDAFSMMAYTPPGVI